MSRIVEVIIFQTHRHNLHIITTYQIDHMNMILGLNKLVLRLMKETGPIMRVRIHRKTEDHFRERDLMFDVVVLRFS